MYQVITRKRRKELGDDIAYRASVEVMPILDLSYIQAPIPDYLPPNDDVPEVVDMPNVNLRIMEGDLNEYVWRTQLFDFLLNQTLLEEPKLQAKIQREDWQFKVILDLAGFPQLYKKMA